MSAVVGFVDDLDRRDRIIFGVVGVFALLAAVAPFLPWVTVYHQDVIHTGLIFVMLGVSWNLIAGYAGQISLGHAAFFGMGAYASAWMTTPGNVPDWLGGPLEGLLSAFSALPFGAVLFPLFAVIVGGLVAAIIALLTGPAMFRLRGHYFAIGTLALAAIIQVIMTNARTYSGGATGYYVADSPDLILPGGIQLTPELRQFYYALIATLLTVVVAYYVYHSKLGLGMRAIHGDEQAADSLGVDPFRYKMYAFVISSFMVGLAGALFAQYTLYLNPGSTLAVVWTIDALVIVILGGMGTIFGPLFGALIFLGLDTFLTDIVGTLATTVEGVLIILFVLFLPNGLYGFIEDRWDPSLLGGEGSEE